MSRYRDIFLDFDDTLYDTHGNACVALGVVFERFGLGRWFERLEDFTEPYWQTNEELWRQYAAGEIDRPYLILERFRRPLSLGKGLEVTEALCHEVSDFFLDCCCEQTGVVPGARELLEYLKGKGYRLHMTSNGFHEVQYRKLERVGMRGYFDTVVLSEDAGVNKPAREFFDYAFRVSGAERGSTIMIGDNLMTDINGARLAGLPQIWYNPKGLALGDFEVTHVVRELGEIKWVL